jgi:hypothetical protein
MCSVPWLNGNLALAEKCSGTLRFRLRQVLLYKNNGNEKNDYIFYRIEEFKYCNILLFLYFLHKLLVAVLSVLRISCVCEWHPLILLVY